MRERERSVCLVAGLAARDVMGCGGGERCNDLLCLGRGALSAVDPEPAESVRKQQLGMFSPPRCCGDEARDALLEVSSCCHCSSAWMMDGWVGTSQPSVWWDLRIEAAREWCFWMRVLQMEEE